MIPIIVVITSLLTTWVIRIVFRWGYNRGYTAAHRRAHPEQLIPSDKYSRRPSVLHP